MKVLDVISESLIGNYMARKIAITAISKGWVKEIKLYKQEFGSIPKVDDLMGFAPAEKLTVEKAIARDPEVQAKAYKEAMKLYKEEERKVILKGVGIVADNIASFFYKNSRWWKWGAVTYGAFGSLDAWDEYKNKQLYAVSLLESGGLTPEQFKTYHDRIFIAFIAKEAIILSRVIVTGGLAGAIELFPTKTARFFLNLTSGLTTIGAKWYTDQLVSPEGSAKLIYLLTAQGMQQDGIQLPPDSIGSAIENLLTSALPTEDYFKKLALEAAQKGGQGDKIPPSLRPKAEPTAKPTSSSITQPPATSSATSVGNSNEEEPPVSGGTRQRPQQGAQPANPNRTSSEWK